MYGEEVMVQGLKVPWGNMIMITKQERFVGIERKGSSKEL